jgi:hypothetical protein
MGSRMVEWLDVYWVVQMVGLKEALKAEHWVQRKVVSKASMKVVR